MKIAYSISERNDRKYWTRIGVAFTNKDGSINVILNCLPIDGKAPPDAAPGEDDIPF